MLKSSGVGLTPQSGTLRLYVDGTLGSDAAAGTSWATAWKTMAKCVAGISGLLSLAPSDVQIVVRHRGDLSAENLQLAVPLTGNSSVMLIHDLTDHTPLATGTLQTVTAATEKHTLARLTLAGGLVVSTDHLGMVLRLSDGTNIGTSTIIKVDTVNNYVWTTKRPYPAWVVGGGGLTADIYSPSSSFSQVAVSSPSPDVRIWSAFPLAGHSLVMVQTKAQYFSFASSTRNLASGLAMGNATSAPIQSVGGMTYCLVSDTAVSAAMKAELVTSGFLAGATGYVALGLSATGAAPYYSVVAGFTGYFRSCGYFASRLSVNSGAYLACDLANHKGLDSTGGTGVTYYAMSRGQILLSLASAELDISSMSFDVPTAGIASGLIRVKEGFALIAADVEGINTAGAGTTLYGVLVDRGGGRIRFSGSYSLLTGKHGDIVIRSGGVGIGGDVTVGAREGGGPDIFVGGAGTLHFEGSFTKSAKNTGASAVLEVADNGVVTQASGKTFTLSTPAADWATDFGANGAIYLHEGAKARLRTLVGGAAGTTGVAVKLANMSDLIHSGVGLLGVAPIQIGGSAAAAWPAAPLSDALAGTPQFCRVVPNVT